MLPPRRMYQEENTLPAGPKSGTTNIAGLFSVNVTVERGELSDQKYKKFSLQVAPYMRVEQLRRKIETEFESIYPREPNFVCGKLEDIGGKPLQESSLVCEVLNSGSSVFAYPKMYEDHIDDIPSILGPKDLIYALKNSHYSIVQQITDTYIADYENKADLIQTIMALGMTKDKQLVHNLCIVMVKLCAEQKTIDLFDTPDNKNMLDLTVLAIEKWINTFAKKDKFVLNNTCKILEYLLKSRLFYEKFKNKPCLDLLIRISRDPLTPTATKALILKITSGYSTILTTDIIKYYQLDNPDFKRYGSLSTSLLKKDILDSNNGRFLDPEGDVDTPISTPNPSSSKYSLGSSLSRSTTNLRASLPLINSARTNFENPKFELPSWAKAIPEYMDPDSLRPAKQLRGFIKKRGVNLIENIKSEDERILKNRIAASRDIYQSPLYKITYFSDGRHPSDALPPGKKSYNKDLVQNYLEMLNSENNSKDMVVTALNNLVQMLDYSGIIIMESTSKFLQACQVLEMVDLDYDAMESQKKFINELIQRMDKERAYDALISEIIERIVFSYKFHHPTIRKVLEFFIDSVIENGRRYLKASQFIEITRCSVTPIRELAMKALTFISENKFSGGLKDTKIDIKFHTYIPYLIRCARGSSVSQAFKNYALQVLANLADREYLRPHIQYNEGLKVFIEALRDYDNLTGRRIAGRAIVNATKTDNELRIKLIDELRGEVTLTWLDDIDPVVSHHIQKLLKGSEF
ncbi:unnamed protein product [Moneuplotes crassus]|uniref:Uncharacterized protein n=1 Tax=Euplotes crassus TaxID=5936 RepID=A0AAD1Y9E2_EUPCR|nr:unnamed protein product [Moneuplotes crassus]